VLTGGNDLAVLPGADRPAPERDRTERAILDHAAQAGTPVLGVCRGMQMMNDYLGGRLTPVDGHVAVRHPLRMAADSPFVLPDEVNSFHNWAVPEDGLGRDLSVLVWAGDGVVEAVWHARLPWLGIMWHPERETPFRTEDLSLFRLMFGT